MSSNTCAYGVPFAKHLAESSVIQRAGKEKCLQMVSKIILMLLFPKRLWSVITEAKIGHFCRCISPFPSCCASLMLSFSSNPAPLPYPLLIPFLFSVLPFSFPCFLCTPRFAGPSGSAPAMGHCRAGALPQPHSQLHPRLHYCCGGIWHHQWVRASLFGSAGIYALRAQLARFSSCF